jgi:hypothetical protein
MGVNVGRSTYDFRAYPMWAGVGAAGRSGPKAGAAAPAEPGSPPGGAERSRVLEPVEKV